MKKYYFISVVILAITLSELNAQGPANLQVYKISCTGGNEWSGWVSDTRPCFYFTFPEPFIMVEVTVTNVPYGGTYTQTYQYNSSVSCNQWPETLALVTGRYVWNVRVYYFFPPGSIWTWTPATWGSEFDVDVTPPNPPIVTDNDCGGSHTGYPAWINHTSPYFTWDNPGDVGSGVSYYQVSVNGGGWNNVSTFWHPTYEGSNYFNFRSVDNAGNASSSYIIYIRTDNSHPPAPSVMETHIGIEGIWSAHTSPNFVWMPVFDAGFPLNGSGINRYEVSVNSDEWSTVSAPWHPTYATGQYTFKFRSVDNVGLASGYNSPNIIYIDDSPPDPPVVTETHCGGSNSENPPWSSHTSPNFTWSIPYDAGSGILPNGFQVSVNSGEWTIVSSGFHPEYTNGSYTFDFQSIDRVGHTSTSYRLYVRIHAPVKIYVKQDASGSNNGTSWTDAFTDLQSALSSALPNDTIWVAAGTYKPSVDKTGNGSPSDPRTKTFQLVSNVPLYGGFAGTETKLNNRNPGSNKTILSGDIGTPGDNSDNCYSVVTGGNNSTLDGFTVTGGNGDGSVLEKKLGGGLSNNSISNLKTSNCIFINNFAKNGGAVGNNLCTDSIIFRNCLFLSNSGYSGGAIGNWNTRAYVTNCIFAGNSTSTASSQGAAVLNWGSGSTSQMNNCTFYNNIDANLRGAIHSYGVTSTATNCILWGNNAIDIANLSGGGCSLTYSCIEQSGYAGSNGNISSNPQFVDAVNGDFRLKDGSACIDAGNGSSSPKLDLAGNSRIDNPKVSNTGTGDPVYSDIGAYEWKPSIIRVKQNASGSNNGTSWTDAYTDLQPALSSAILNDTIWVAAGTYKPTVDNTGNSSPADPRTKVFQLVNNVPVFGGFSGTETKLIERNPGGNETILSGFIGPPYHNTDNCYSVVKGANNSTLDGFTVTGGNGNGSVSLETDLGGGLVNYYVSNVKIRNCIFRGNFSKMGGAAGNYFCTDSIIFNNCKFLANSAYNGGAIGNWNTKAYITNCLFTGNSTYSANNYGGAAIFNLGSGSSSQIINCTLYNNIDANLGGAIHNKEVTSTATNCILWGNVLDIVQTGPNSGCAVSYSCIEQSGYAGSNGNISSDPQFMDAAGGDFRVTSASPCVDAGDGNAATKLDLAGNQRFDYPDIINTGIGDPVFSDIGALECMLLTDVENPFAETYKIYPNPASGVFTLSGPDFQQIKVYNIQGALVFENTDKMNHEINISQQPKGIYLIKITTVKMFVVKKIIIH